MAACAGCGAAVAVDALACPHCHTLVHAAELGRLTTRARALEAAGELQVARGAWCEALALLPPDTRQAMWIAERLGALAGLPDAPPVTTNPPAQDDTGSPSARPGWAKWMAPLVPLVIVLLKGKWLLSLFKAKWLLSLGAFVAVYWSMFGFAFGLGFAVLVLVHELGHYADIRRRGLPADMPMFLPGLGAYVRWQALGVTARTRAFVSLAGPLAGLMAAVACAGVWRAGGGAIWSALAYSSAWLNALNLIPVPVLDGGHASAALDRSDRAILLLLCVVVWIASSESVFFLVVLGAAWRLFSRDRAPAPDRRVLAYYVLLLAGLAVVMRAVPAAGPLPAGH